MNSQKFKNSNPKQQKLLSKSKMKMLSRKAEMRLSRNIQKEARVKVMESLERHNREEGMKINCLDSSKNLGRKRKKSKDKKLKEKVEEEDEAIEENESISEDSRISITNQPKFKEIQKNDELSPAVITSSLSSFPQHSILDDNTLKNIQKEIHEYRQKQEEQELQAEMEEIIFENKYLIIPKESDLILVKRNENIQKERVSLPIIQHEHDIMYAIDNSLVTVICGETGSGKSTQLPQFLYEKGYTKALGSIAITQPRRVAAVSLATRVAEEMNVKLGEEVGYQVRYDSAHFSSQTVIKYLTDGILIKELESDKLLLKYSIVIIDEAHERTINTDILIGMLSQILKLRFLFSKNQIKFTNGEIVKPLRLVIMSATMRVDEFLLSPIFKPGITPRIVRVESRQYPVTIYHSKKTMNDYIKEAFSLIIKIHKKLPDGGVIVFLTGKKEILELCKMLRNEFEKTYIREEDHEEASNEDNFEKLYDQNELSELPPKEEHFSYKPFMILPLFSSLPQEEQLKVFQKYPGKRLIVVATNVAETSLTIPGVRYVIDSGRVKKRIYKHGLSFSSFEVEWISQASAQQRSGRAGRTCEGYCYRLYSTGLFSKMEEYNEPQVTSVPLDQVILFLKSMHVNNISKFPFITPPNKVFVQKAIEHLMIIGAVNCQSEEENKRIIRLDKLLMEQSNSEEIYEENTSITDIGLLMSKFPIPPKYAKMLIISQKFGLLPYSLLLISAMSMENIFLSESSIAEGGTSISLPQEGIKKGLREILCKSSLINPFSDSLTLLNLSLLFFRNNNKTEKAIAGLCEKYTLNSKKVREMLELIDQLTKLSQNSFNNSLNTSTYASIQFPNSQEQSLLLQIMTACFIDNIARKKVIFDQIGNEEEKLLKKKTIYECNENNNECAIHPFSILHENPPDYLIYKEIIKDSKTFLVCNSVIQPEWLYNIGGSLVSASLALNIRQPFYSSKEDSIFCFMNITYGFKSWEIPNVKVEMSKTEDNYARYFARFFLEGEIIQELKGYRLKLNSNPKIITDQLSDIFYKVSRLVHVLKDCSVLTRGALINKWKDDKNFLKDIYLLWFDDNKVKTSIKQHWPPVKLSFK